MARVIAIGECMVELSLIDGANAVVGYAGDVFNTAVYLSRLGIEVDFATALGSDDPFSDGIVERLNAEGVGDDLIPRVIGRPPGLYAIERDAAGERRFFYWRDQAPVRQLFELADLNRLAAALRRADLIYFSGVTLAVLGEAGRARLLGLVADAVGHGARVALDPNYRSRLWPSADVARTSLEAFAPHCAFLSVSAPDLTSLYDAPMRSIAAEWAARGTEVVTRADDLAVEVYLAGEVQRVPPGPRVSAVDTTGAGDSFNAGYLATRLTGGSPKAAVEAGRRISAAVVQRIGAIIPRKDMPVLAAT
jgi:2-dehydro-3-deoxygluconokinase